MTDLYKRFAEDMDLAGYSPRSIDSCKISVLTSSGALPFVKI